MLTLQCDERWNDSKGGQMEMCRHFRACKTTLRQTLWSHQCPRKLCPMFVMAGCCCPLEISNVNERPEVRSLHGNISVVNGRIYTLWKPGGSSPASITLEVEGCSVGHRLAAFTGTTESFGFILSPIPLNWNVSALSTPSYRHLSKLSPSNTECLPHLQQ